MSEHNKPHADVMAVKTELMANNILESIAHYSKDIQLAMVIGILECIKHELIQGGSETKEEK